MQTILDLLRPRLDAAWRHRWLALGLAWLLCLAGWTAVRMIPNQYEVNARIYVDADAVLTPLLRGIALDSSPYNQLEILQRTLLSTPNLETLISKTELELREPTPATHQELLAALARTIRVQSQDRNLFAITYRSTSPQLAYDVVNTLVSIFMENATGSNRTDMANARRFLDEQISQYEQRLREAEHRRAEFLAKYVDVLPGANGGASRLEVAREDQRRLQGELADAQNRYDTLQAALQTTPPVLTGAAAVGGNSELAAAELKLRELRLRFTDQHPEVITQRRLVDALRGTSSNTPGAGRPVPNPVYEQLKLRVLDAETTVASLTRQVKDADAERARLEAIARGEPGLQAEFVNIDRDYNILKRNYDELLARRESMRISTAANKDADKIKLKVVDPPMLPRVPVAPKRVLLMTAVLALGFAGGAGAAVALSLLDTSFGNVEGLRTLGVPVLGGVSAMTPSTRVGWARSVAQATAFGAGVVLLIVVYGGLLAHMLGLPLGGVV